MKHQEKIQREDSKRRLEEKIQWKDTKKSIRIVRIFLKIVGLARCSPERQPYSNRSVHQQNGFCGVKGKAKIHEFRCGIGQQLKLPKILFSIKKIEATKAKSSFSVRAFRREISALESKTERERERTFGPFEGFARRFRERENKWEREKEKEENEDCHLQSNL